MVYYHHDGFLFSEVKGSIVKIFLDTANPADIKRFVHTGLIDGVTTNPTHLAQVNKNPKKTILEICSLLPEGRISVQVTQEDPKKIYKQAQQIAHLAPNIWVKVPCHSAYYPVIDALVKEGVRLNITLVFTLLQALMMCKLGADYISPFVGRWGDIDVEGIPIIVQMREMIDFYNFETHLLAASIRDLPGFHESVQAGVDAVTLPPAIFEKAINHPLTKQGMEKFAKDWHKVGVKTFPG